MYLLEIALYYIILNYLKLHQIKLCYDTNCMMIAVSDLIPTSDKVTSGFSFTHVLNTFLGNIKRSSKFREDKSVDSAT